MGLDTKNFICILITLLHIVNSAEVIKIATFVPASSPWAKVLNVWADAVAKKSNDGLQIQFFYNSVQGNEDAIVRKMKSGQLDGALLTTVGLGRIYTPILGLQMPGLFKTWSKLYTARQAMNSDFQQGMNTAGFNFIGWSDFGAVHLLSKGFAVRTPKDLKGNKLFIDVSNPIDRVLSQVISDSTSVSASVSEVLPKLITGAINIVNTPALVAEQLQWSSKLDTINKDVSALVTGGLVILSRRINALSPALRGILLDTATIATNALTKRITDEDNASFTRLQNKMQVITLTSDELLQWNATYKEIRRILSQGVFSASLVTRLEQLAN